MVEDNQTVIKHNVPIKTLSLTKFIQTTVVVCYYVSTKLTT